MKKYRGMNNRGDAIMVTSVILFSLFLSAGSNYLLQYGEIVGKESDMEHVADVEEALLRIRTSMNALITSKETNTMIMNRVPLGTPGNPYLTVARSSGVLTHTADPGSFHLELLIKSESGGTETVLDSINGDISYHSNNFYFHDQTYYFTAGGIILEQYGSLVMSSYPDICLVKTDDGYSMQLFLYGMVGDYWKIMGIDSLPLKVRMAGYSEIEKDLDTTTETFAMKINGVGEKAWYDYMNGYLVEKGLKENNDFKLTPPADWNDPALELEIEFPCIDSIFVQLGDMEVEV